MKLAGRVLLVLVFVLGTSVLSARAWMRMRYEDSQVVERSEVIVVGAIKDGSVVVVPHTRDRSWETHATLLIHEVIKGECKEKELPIVIRYGLDVLVDGEQRVGQSTLEGATTLPVAKKTMSIYDTGNSHMGGRAVADDARKDHLWFLRHGGERAEAEDKSFGIEDPEDVQAVDIRKYMESYLAADPEAGVRAALQEHPEIAGRAVRYLQHREIERIMKEKDAAVRVERLLPYYTSRSDWGYRWEARAGIVAAGAVAGPYLMAWYERSWGEPRMDVIRLWGEIEYRGCVATLVEVLKGEDPFWARQDLQAGWWNADVGSALTERRRDSFSMVYAAVCALGKIGDSRALEALEMTRRRWAGMHVDNTQMVKACDEAIGVSQPARAK